MKNKSITPNHWTDLPHSYWFQIRIRKVNLFLLLLIHASLFKRRLLRGLFLYLSKIISTIFKVTYPHPGTKPGSFIIYLYRECFHAYMRREHLRDYTLVSTPIGAIISLRDEATRKIIARYLITYRLREALTQAILDLKKQYPDPYVTPEIRLPDTERFLWNFYYHCLYEEGKITCKQLAEYIFNYKVAVHYSIRAEYNFSYRHKTYYEGIDYHFTAIAPVCIDLDDTNELFNLAVNDAYTRLGFMINGKFNFNHEGHISTPTIISAQIVGHPTLGKLVNKKNTFKLDARQEDF